MRPIQESFNGGQWTPLLEGRSDLEKYGAALYRGENFVLDPRGPALLRPGFRYIAETKDSAAVSVLIPFEFSVTQTYMLEFGDKYLRVFKDQDVVLDGASAYEVVTPYSAADLATVKYTQSADVLYLFHPDYAPRKLSRTGDTSWTLTEINFKPGALSEQAIEPATTLTLSAVTGTGVTATAGSSVFQTGDVGRIIASGLGRASITAFTSGTVVTVDVIDDFAAVGPIASGDWEMQGSPSGSVAPADSEPTGKITTLSSQSASETFTDLLGNGSNYWTLSGSGATEYYLISTAPGYPGSKPSKIYIEDVEAVEGLVGSLGILQWDWADNDGLGYSTIYVRLADGADPDSKAAHLDEDFVQRSAVSAETDLFRSTDVGKYVRINNGLVKITSYVDATEVKGEILKAMDSTTASSTWTLESEVWTSGNGYPSCGTFFEDRLVLAGSTAYTETVWGSVVGDYENFTPGTDDTDAFEFTLASRQVQVIRWIEPREYLLVGTAGGEWRLGPEDTGDPLTPFNVVAKEETKHGSANILPVTVTGATLLVQRAKRKIREFTYNFTDDGYRAPDMTLLAEDITSGSIAGMVYQEEPYSLVWVYLEDGTLLSMSYLREQDVIGWMKHPMGTATVESMAVIPGDGYDEVWAIINRTVDGSTVRYVEMMEPVFRDNAATFASNLGLNARFLDSAIVYNGASTTTITGLDHLEGETVSALVNGMAATGFTVASGQITLPIAATVVHVGLFNTATLQLMRLDGNTQEGSIQGKRKKIDELVIRVLNSSVFKAGPDESNLDVVYDRDRQLYLGQAHPLASKDLEVGYDGGWEQEARPMIVQDQPLPLIVLAIMEDVDV